MSITPSSFAYYGDDFTGSTDSLDMLARYGINSILIPERAIDTLPQYAGYDVIGVAGRARSMTPRQMEEHLPHIFQTLKNAGRSLVHYKVCSTFDSSPNIGNMAKAARIAMQTFGGQLVPVLGGAPALARYCVFGNLFASYGNPEQIFRIDRHPVMSQHPVTPMREGDLRDHFQTLLPDSSIDSLNLGELRQKEVNLRRLLASKALREPGFLIFDALEPTDTDTFARLVLEPSEGFSPSILVGGSSIEDAFARHWSEAAEETTVASVEQLLVFSASCSPTSKVQIEQAQGAGFSVLAVDTPGLLERPEEEQERLLHITLKHLREGASLVVHTCLGGEDLRQQGVQKVCAAYNISAAELSQRIGSSLGQVLQWVLETHAVQRVVLAGGDFSSNVINSLDVNALAFAFRVAPGAPLCQLKSPNPHLDGIEIALKGGQLGQPDYYPRLLSGSTHSGRQ